jgi:hypothetical protein
MLVRTHTSLLGALCLPLGSLLAPPQQVEEAAALQGEGDGSCARVHWWV